MTTNETLAAAGITKTEKDGIVFYTATVRKCETTLAVLSSGGVNVNVRNASSRAWRGGGKFAPNLGALRQHYKSAALVAFVEACQADFEGVVIFSK